MNIDNVLKPWLITIIFKSIKEHVLERNLLNATNVVKPLYKRVIS